MAGLTNKKYSSIQRRFFRFIEEQTATTSLAFVLRPILIAAIVAGVMICAPTRNARPARLAESASDCPPTQSKTNLVFVIDRSGSMANAIATPGEHNVGRGQTYNVEIEGVMCALLDPSVVPRNGSVAVGAVLFDGAATVALQLSSPITSDAQARALAAQIEMLRCVDTDPSCASGDTNFDTAIREADRIAGSRQSGRRVLIMSTDGSATDPDRGIKASEEFVQHARRDGIVAELDVLLIGMRDDEREKNKAMVGDIVVPGPSSKSDVPSDPPGAVEEIKKSACNEAGNLVFGTDCACQVRQYADFTRRALRSNIASRNLTVNTLDDSDPKTPVVDGGPMSLRQSIETANGNDGRTTITFDSSLAGAAIQPKSPLPPLIAPDITICGCAGGCGAPIPEKATCPQASQSDARPCDQMVTIDGRHALEDGILIRSNRDVVRGLRIVNFRHAGIVIQPVCSSDNTGFNRIELNKLEDNSGAGVCVLDPPSQLFAVAHNVGNTISMNDISGSETPIDLEGDGPTRNDVEALSAGPNALLNYPAPFAARTAGNILTVTGTVTIPTVECPIYDQSIVEVFAVTKIHPASGMAIVDAVTFFGRIPVDEKKGGAFTMQFAVAGGNSPGLINGLKSPIDGYTATFTDRAGNTSELIPFCTGPPKSKVSPESIEFKRVNPGPNSNGATESFAIENCGCSKLDLSMMSILRAGADAAGLVRQDDSDSKKGSGFFSLRQINDSNEQAIPVHNRDGITIDPGRSQRFSIGFNPAIPRAIPAGGDLLPIDVLPSDLPAILSFQQLDIGALRLSLTGRVTTPVKLIDPDSPSGPAKVTLTRSGDNLTVVFAVFDSNLNVNNAVLDVSYEFIEDGGTILPKPPDTNLAEAIRTRRPRLVQGQSFRVIQRFSNAKQHKNVSGVVVTVSDGETTVSATSTSGLSLTGMARADSFRDERGASLILPVVRLGSARADRSPVERRTSAQEEKRR